MNLDTLIGGTARPLTRAQHARLEHIARDEEGTRVVGWRGPDYDHAGGPIIRRQHNGHPRLDFAAFRWVSPAGHLMPMSRAALADAGLSLRGVVSESSLWGFAATGQTHRALADVLAERSRQEQLKAAGRFEFTAADYPGLAEVEKLAMLVEEVGEVARCIQERAGNVNDGGEKPSRDDLRIEVIQCAAIATAWAESL